MYLKYHFKLFSQLKTVGSLNNSVILFLYIRIKQIKYHLFQ